MFLWWKSSYQLSDGRTRQISLTSAVFELMTKGVHVHLLLCRLIQPLPLSYQAPRNCAMVGRGKEGEQQIKTAPDSVTSEGTTEGKVPWIPMAKTHTTWKEKRKENPIWDFKRKVERIHAMPFGKGAQAGKCCNSNMLCSEKVLMVQPSCIITHKQERPCRTVGVF